jgi:hypothetical protein
MFDMATSNPIKTPAIEGSHHQIVDVPIGWQAKVEKPVKQLASAISPRSDTPNMENARALWPAPRDVVANDR